MEVEYEVVCAIVAIPLCMALLALIALREAGAKLRACRTHRSGRP